MSIPLKRRKEEKRKGTVTNHPTHLESIQYTIVGTDRSIFNRHQVSISFALLSFQRQHQSIQCSQADGAGAITVSIRRIELHRHVDPRLRSTGILTGLMHRIEGRSKIPTTETSFAKNDARCVGHPLHHVESCRFTRTSWNEI